MPRAPSHPILCLFHARAEHELLAADEAAKRLVSISGEFKTASDVNRVLGQLFSLVAQNRIPHREAVSLAYIAQLLLQSLPHVRNEIQRAHGIPAWGDTVRRVLTAVQPQPVQNQSASQPTQESRESRELSLE